MISQPTLWDVAARTVQDTSLEAYLKILPTLTKREIAVFFALWDYLHATGHSDATGAELTGWMVRRQQARDFNDCRPRITGLLAKGWVEKVTARKCRQHGTTAHPVRPCVPRAAVARMQTKDHS